MKLLLQKRDLLSKPRPLFEDKKTLIGTRVFVAEMSKVSHHDIKTITQSETLVVANQAARARIHVCRAFSRAGPGGI